MSTENGWKWKWSNGVIKSEMIIIWCTYIYRVSLKKGYLRLSWGRRTIFILLFLTAWPINFNRSATAGITLSWGRRTICSCTDCSWRVSLHESWRETLQLHDALASVIWGNQLLCRRTHTARKWKASLLNVSAYVSWGYQPVCICIHTDCSWTAFLQYEQAYAFSD